MSVAKRQKLPVKKWCITAVLLVALAVMGIRSYQKGQGKTMLVYADSLEQVAAEVNGSTLTLRQLAFYVAYEEDEVERQAYIYNPKDTNIYWNLHANNTYIRTAARNAAIQMALHDELFYQLAVEEGVNLSRKEEDTLSEKIREYWTELVDYGKAERLGVDRDDVAQTMRKIAYAQKMQYIYAITQGMDEEDFGFTADAYQQFLKKQDYTIEEDVWGRVDFGNVTLIHWEK
ncbi:MAG: hypothetical protein MR016_05090 [Agathobacter sp.]|nr:hypothetical protein [Agathobacter sp.]